MEKISNNIMIRNILSGKLLIIDKQTFKNCESYMYNKLWNTRVSRVASIKQVGYNINLCVGKKIDSSFKK